MKFVFTGKLEGDYRLVGVEVTFRQGETLVIGDVQPSFNEFSKIICLFTDACIGHPRDGVVREVSLDKDQRIIGFHFTKPREKPKFILQTGFSVLISKGPSNE